MPEIRRLILEPLMSLCPPEVEMYTWLEELFQVKYRNITRYRVRDEYRLEGLLMVTPYNAVQGVGDKHLRPGEILFTRTDDRERDVVHVERCHPEGVYLLNEYQWNRLKRHVTEVAEGDKGPPSPRPRRAAIKKKLRGN